MRICHWETHTKEILNIVQAGGKWSQIDAQEIKEEMKGNSKYLGESEWILTGYNNSSIFSLTYLEL